MLRLFGLGIGALWVFVGWRNLPPMGESSALAAGTAIAVCCWVSWWCGKTMTAASATAVAVARAEARAASLAASTSSAQAVGQIVVVGDPGAAMTAVERYQARQGVAGLDRAGWIGGPVGMVEQDVLEQVAEDVGMDEAVRESG